MNGGEKKRGSDDGTGRLDFTEIYGTGAAIGMTPRQVDEISMAELDAAVTGWNRAQGAEEPMQPPSDAAIDKAVAKFMKG